MRNSMIYLGIFLAVVCLASASALAMTNLATDPLIREHQEESRREAMNEVLPDADNFEDVSEEFENLLEKDEFADIREINAAYQNGDPVGYVFEASIFGYADEVVIVIGISEDEIAGVNILQQAETPGLGARIEEEEFRGQFYGLSTREEIALEDDGGQIDSLAGATESSEVVTAGVEQARTLYEQIKEER